MIYVGPWLNNTRKSAAGMTAVRLKGQNVLKGKRKKGITNKSPQVLQAENAAALIWPIYRAIIGSARVGFTSHLEKQSAANAFYKYTFDNALDLSVLPDATLVPGDLLVSKGLITPTPFASAPVVDASASTVALTWGTALLDDTQLDTDVMYAVVHNRTTGAFAPADGHVARSAGTLTPGIPEGFAAAGNVVDVYMFFIGAPLTDNSGKSSTSVTTFVTTVA